MVQRSDISSLHWQPALGSFDVVEAAADVNQAIRIILGTPKGSDPHRPEFGTNIHLYLDHPVDIALPHMVREAIQAITRWEPRCTVIKVTRALDASHGTLRVLWKLADGVQRETKWVL